MTDQFFDFHADWLSERDQLQSWTHDSGLQPHGWRSPTEQEAREWRKSREAGAL